MDPKSPQSELQLHKHFSFLEAIPQWDVRLQGKDTLPLRMY